MNPNDPFYSDQTTSYPQFNQQPPHPPQFPMNPGQYPQSGQFGPPPQQPLTFKQKFRALPRWKRFGSIGCGCLSMLFVFLVLCSIVGNTLPKQPSQSVASVPTHQAISVKKSAPTPTPTTAPTKAPMPSPSPSPIPKPPKPATLAENMPVLGGSVSAFDKKLGADHCCYQNGWDTDKKWVGVSTMENGGSSIGFDEHSHNRVVGVRIHPYGTIDNASTPTWSLDEAKNVCNTYLPLDASLKDSQPYQRSDIVVGVIYTYSSTLLAHTLPANAFTDVNEYPVQPGTFYVFMNYLSASETSKIDHCSIGTDRSLKRENE